MKEYMVLYYIRSVMNPLNQPFGFYCLAASEEAAEEQCRNAHPRSGIVWVYQSSDYDEALSEFYSRRRALW